MSSTKSDHPAQNQTEDVEAGEDGKGGDEKVKNESESDSDKPTVMAELVDGHGTSEDKPAVENEEPQRRLKSPPKRSNSELQDDEDDDEPVKKRPKRGGREGKTQPKTSNVTSNDTQDRSSKTKTTAATGSKRRAEKKASSTKAESLKKAKSTAPTNDEESKATSRNPEERQSDSEDGINKEASEPADKSNAEPEEDMIDASEEEDADKAHEETQTILKSRTKDPYPDWKSGEPVPYAALCTTFALIEMTTKRLVIMAHCTLFLRQVLRLTPQDLLPTVQLMINKIAADYTGIELGIGEHLIMKAIGESTGRSIDVVKADNKSIGDLGLVAIKSRSTQRTLYKPKPLTVRGVLEGLMAIATTSGDGSQGLKVSGIKKLLSAADSANAGKGSKGIDITSDKGGASESKFIIRFLEGKLRLGLAEKTVLVSLAHAMVAHELGKKSNKPPSTERLSEGTEILKVVYRLSHKISEMTLSLTNN